MYGILLFKDNFPILPKNTLLKQTLVLFAHPYLEFSQSNRELTNFYVRHQHYHFRDLYEEFPDFHIPAFRERKRIVAYDRFIFHFPLIWFGVPPLLKLWIDEVLDARWLDAASENPLENKEVFFLITTNYRREHFLPGGLIGKDPDTLLSGFYMALEQCGMKRIFTKYIYNADLLSKKEIVLNKQEFSKHLNS